MTGASAQWCPTEDYSTVNSNWCEDLLNTPVLNKSYWENSYDQRERGIKKKKRGKKECFEVQCKGIGLSSRRGEEITVNSPLCG